MASYWEAVYEPSTTSGKYYIFALADGSTGFYTNPNSAPSNSVFIGVKTYTPTEKIDCIEIGLEPTTSSSTYPIIEMMVSGNGGYPIVELTRTETGATNPASVIDPIETNIQSRVYNQVSMSGGYSSCFAHAHHSTGIGDNLHCSCAFAPYETFWAYDYTSTTVAERYSAWIGWYYTSGASVVVDGVSIYFSGDAHYDYGVHIYWKDFMIQGYKGGGVDNDSSYDTLAIRVAADSETNQFFHMENTTPYFGYRIKKMGGGNYYSDISGTPASPPWSPPYDADLFWIRFYKSI